MPKMINDQEIYQAAIDAILAGGYAGATTKLIAQSAGVSEATLFRKYGSKAQLIAAAIDQQFLPLRESNMVRTGDIRADLLKVLEIYERSSAKDSRLFSQIISEIARYPELRKTLAGPLTVLSKLGGLIEQYQAAGDLGEEDPILSVIALLGPIILNKMLAGADLEIPIPPIDLAAHINLFIIGRKPPQESRS